MLASPARLADDATATRLPTAPSAAGGRVAVLSTWRPAPADNGRKQRTLAMLDALAQEFEVTLVTLAGADEPVAPVVAMPGVARQYEFPLPVFKPHSPSALVAGLCPLPRSVLATWDPRLANELRLLVARERIDVVIGTDLRTARYLMALGGVVTILDEPDVSPFVRVGRQSRWSGAVWRAAAREWKYRRLVRAATGSLDAALVASHAEAAAYDLLAGAPHATLLENAVSSVPPLPWEPPAGARLLYCGSPRYAPNADAITWFGRDILPAIRAVYPTAHLFVTGALAADPPPSHDGGVCFAGRLDDLALAYYASRVYVVPLRAGTGTRIKILEALSYGMPVVTTSKGAEGLDVVDGEHLLFADTPRDFAAETLRLLGDAAFARELGARGRALVAERYTWERQGARLRDIVRGLLAERGTA